MPDPAPLHYAKLFRSAAHSFRQAGSALRRQCEAAGIDYDAHFWQEAAQEALQAALIVETLQEQRQPISCLVEALRQARLFPFDEVVATGNPDLLVISAVPLPSEAGKPENAGVSIAEAKRVGVKVRGEKWTAEERLRLKRAVA